MICRRRKAINQPASPSPMAEESQQRFERCACEGPCECGGESSLVEQPAPALLRRDGDKRPLSFSEWTALDSFANLSEAKADRFRSRHSHRRHFSTPSSKHQAGSADSNGLLLDPAAAQAPSTGAVGDDCGHFGSELHLRNNKLDSPSAVQEEDAQQERRQSSGFASSSSVPQQQAQSQRSWRSTAQPCGGKLPMNDSASSRPEHVSSAPGKEQQPEADSSLRPERQQSLHSPPLSHCLAEQQPCNSPEASSPTAEPASQVDKPPVLAFSAYAACRFLHTTPENRVSWLTLLTV